MASISHTASQLWLHICERYDDKPALLEFYLIQGVQFVFFWIPATIMLYLDIVFPAWSNGHKIQSERFQPTRAQIKHCVEHVFVNTIIGAVATFAYAWLYDFRFTLFTVSSTLPTAKQFSLGIIYAMFAREILFYWSHRLFHHPRLYKRFHKQHHLFIAPMSFAAQYAHPLEHLLANMVPVIAPLALRKVHIFTFCVYLGWALLETCCAHSGYDFFTWPILGTMHDLHHEKFNVNFGGMGWLDWVCGTGRWYRIRPASADSQNGLAKKKI